VRSGQLVVAWLSTWRDLRMRNGAHPGRVRYDIYVMVETARLDGHMTDFEDLIGQIEREAGAEGPTGRAHLDALRDRFDLVEQIIDRRRELHLTQEQVAAASGLHQSVVSRIEQGVANPTARTLGALARALDARLTITGRRAG
jgi:DNA-binding XRE family transcriptional regulator